MEFARRLELADWKTTDSGSSALLASCDLSVGIPVARKYIWYSR